MKRVSIARTLFILVLIVGMIFLLIYQPDLPEPREEARPQVSVIVSNSSDSRWTRFQAGLEKAADDYRISLNYALTGEFSSLREEEKVIRSESVNADAIIVQLVESSGTMELISDLCAGKALGLVDTDAEAEADENITSINADNSGMGRELADKIRDDLGSDLKGVRIGIVSGSRKMSSMQERMEAFREEAQLLGAEIVFETDRKQGLLMSRTETVDVIAALDNPSLETVVDTIGDSSQIRIYGIGCSDKTIYYLDRGVISAMVVPNDFQMGYLALADIAGRINAPNIPMIHREISYDVITRSNMYDSRNETLLFPVIN